MIPMLHAFASPCISIFYHPASIPEQMNTPATNQAVDSMKLGRCSAVSLGGFCAFLCIAYQTGIPFYFECIYC